jgi:UDP-2-acetamido-2-deoxy-ribo-hexuluronate aminotransferase
MNKPIMCKNLDFIDLERQRARLGPDLDRAIRRVLEHGNYIMGPEVRELETALTEFCGAQHSITCSNGTDALGLILMGLGLGPGDAVLCPSFTFAATAEAVAWFGATPVFVDVDEYTFNLDPASLQIGIDSAANRGLRPAGVISVDLFGQPAAYDRIEAICAAQRLWLLCDAAQSFGATYQARNVGTIGTATATSFFPAKPLGCYGDGGAIMTDDSELAAVITSMRVHGQGSDKYDNVRIGMNARLDTLQAAILLEKLRIFPGEIDTRNEIAARYSEQLARVAVVPHVSSDIRSVWAQYTIRVPAARRKALAAELKARGIPTAIYYGKPLHQQLAYCSYPVAGNGLPITERIAQEVISLPMHPYLEEGEQQMIIDSVIAELAGC